MSYNWKCACGSVFMTEALLAAHRSSNACKPNTTYELKLTVRTSTRHKGSKKPACPECGGKGFREYKDPKRSSNRSVPCKLRCRAVSPYDHFVADCWYGQRAHNG